MALSMQRRPRRYSASRRGVRGRLGAGGPSNTQVSPNVLPVPMGGGTTGEVPSIAQPLGPNQAPPGPAPAQGYGGQGNPSNPFAGTNINYGGSPTQADKAIINGVEVWAGGPYSGMPVAQFPDGGNLTPYLQNPATPAPANSVAGGAPIQKPLVQTPPSGAPVAAPAVAPAGAPPAYDPTNAAQASAAAAQAGQVAPGQKPKFVGAGGVLIYDHGGIVDEPVVGKGARSGKTYFFDTVEITPMDTGLSAKHHGPASAAAPSSAPLKRPGKK